MNPIHKRLMFRIPAAAAIVGLIFWLALPRLERIYWANRLSRVSSAQEEARVFEALRKRTLGFSVVGANGTPLPRALNDEAELSKASAVDIFLDSGGYLLARPIREPRNVLLLREY
jgi:hypothetical protein